MFLSNRDIKWAIDCGKLIVDPRPEQLNCGFDETSIDLHLGPLDTARVWNIEELKREDRTRGRSNDDAPEVALGRFDWESFAARHQNPIPELSDDQARERQQLVYRKGQDVVVRRFGFLLWATKEKVGTPKVDPVQLDVLKRHPELICFVNGKSTRARTGLLVHFTAPTIHAGWVGNITLEIANLGPFTFVLREDDVIAQLTVATISSAPDLGLRVSRSRTHGQTDPSGSASAAPDHPPRGTRGNRRRRP